MRKSQINFIARPPLRIRVNKPSQKQTISLLALILISAVAWQVSRHISLSPSTGPTANSTHPSGLLGPIVAPLALRPIPPHSKLEDTLLTAFQSETEKKDLEISRAPEGVSITLRSDTLFVSGDARVRYKGLTELRKLTEIIHQFAADAPIAIEGHTDDMAVVKMKHQYPSNWELSSARATQLIHLFENAGFNKDQLQLLAFGDTRPRVANLTPEGEPIPENRSANRRLVVRIGASAKNE